MLTPETMRGGRCTPPPLSFFLPVTQNYHEAPISEYSWPCKPFCCGWPDEKKIKKFSFNPLSEHFEIWVWKPAMAERVNSVFHLRGWRGIRAPSPTTCACPVPTWRACSQSGPRTSTEPPDNQTWTTASSRQAHIEKQESAYPGTISQTHYLFSISIMDRLPTYLTWKYYINLIYLHT